MTRLVEHPHAAGQWAWALGTLVSLQDMRFDACESDGGTPRSGRDPLEDKATRLKARRAKKRLNHEREMDQRIDKTMNTLRTDLEAFCEKHFLLEAPRRAPGGSDGGRVVWADGPRDGSGGPSGSFVSSVPQIASGFPEQSPLASGIGSLAGLHGLSLSDGPLPHVGLQGQEADDYRDHAGWGGHRVDHRASWAAFCRVCTSAGLDPLLLYYSVSLKQASNAAGRRFIVEDSPVYRKYLNALSVVVLDVCDAQRVLTGGLCPLDRLVERVRRRGGAWLHGRGQDMVQKDVMRAVDAMREALVGSGGVSPGSSVGVVVISGRAYVSTVDFVMDDDCIELLKLFQAAKEGISRREAMDALRWTEPRVVDALEKLMRDGIVWLDMPPEAMPPLYWCLCMT